MGSAKSRIGKGRGALGPITDRALQECIDRLQLKKKDVRKIWKRFSHYDKDKSGAIDVEEFFSMIGEEKTAFGNEVFELVDLDSDGTVDFSEFVSLTTKFCLLGKDDMLRFCFNVHDRDKNGTLEHDELTGLVQMMHGQDQKSNCDAALEQIAADENSDGRIDFVELVKLNETFPLLLYPAFRIQESLMIATFGELWWQKKREELGDAKSPDQLKNEKLMAAKSKREAYRAKRMVQMEMGIFKYYFQPWKRQIARLEVTKKVAIRRARRERREKEKKGIKERMIQQSRQHLKEILDDSAEKEKIIEKEKDLEPLEKFTKRMEKETNIDVITKELKKRREARQKALGIS